MPTPNIKPSTPGTERVPLVRRPVPKSRPIRPTRPVPPPNYRRKRRTPSAGGGCGSCRKGR